jgi:CheY-like chemotaxis protein
MMTKEMWAENVVKSCKTSFPMHTLVLCSDVQFLGTTRNVLNELNVTPKIVGSSDEALVMIHAHEFDVIVVDWREINNLSDFLCAVRRSKLNRESVLVAIVRDLLDLRQAFAAGVHFLIHKPASVVQIERCLRAAYGATITRRRKQHREPVSLPASVSTRNQPYAEVTVENLSEGGAGVRLRANGSMEGAYLSVSEEVDLRFVLPGIGATMHTTGKVVWTTADAAGIRFTDIPESERSLLESWLTACVERSLAELCQRLQQACA